MWEGKVVKVFKVVREWEAGGVNRRPAEAVRSVCREPRKPRCTRRAGLCIIGVLRKPPSGGLRQGNKCYIPRDPITGLGCRRCRTAGGSARSAVCEPQFITGPSLSGGRRCRRERSLKSLRSLGSLRNGFGWCKSGLLKTTTPPRDRGWSRLPA